jgi:rhamnogalacturonyl hydrolase YesR
VPADQPIPVQETPVQEAPVQETIERVTRAMLSMQRAAWEQGVAAQALLELGEQEMAVLMAREAIVRRVPDGRVAILGSGTNVTDPAVNGEPLLYAARVTGDPGGEFGAAADGLLDYLLHIAPRTADGTLCHLTDSVQLWDDSIYMAPPFLALAGEPDEALRQIDGYRAALWDPAARLFAHIWDAGQGKWVDPGFWGVGNGWAAAGMARVIKALPVEMIEERQRLIGHAREVIDGCLAHQRPDGLFHNMVDQPGTFVETNLAQMLAYTIYRGTEAGWLEARYRAAADSMRRAAHAKVGADGLVQGVCGSPDFAHPGVATEGQAFFLLMEAAYRDLTA